MTSWILPPDSLRQEMRQFKAPHAYKPGKLTCTKFRTVAMNANRQANHHQSDLSKGRSETCVPETPASQQTQLSEVVHRNLHICCMLCKCLNELDRGYVMWYPSPRALPSKARPELVKYTHEAHDDSFINHQRCAAL